MNDPKEQTNADRLDRGGEDPAAESGAGYGSHAPEPDVKDEPEAHPS